MNTEMDLLANGNDMVFDSKNNTIQSGGFSVTSIMLNSGMSPIMTMNTNNMLQSGGSNKVSDLFQNLAVPNWATMYPMKGGEYKEDNKHKETEIDEDLHDKLLELVKDRKPQEKTNKKQTQKIKNKKVGKKGTQKNKK